MPTVIIHTPNYFQEKLPADQWKYHYEVRRNYGTDLRPNWQTVKYADTEQEANDWASVN